MGIGQARGYRLLPVEMVNAKRLEMLIDRSYQFEIFGRIDCPAKPRTIFQRFQRANLKLLGVTVSVKRHVLAVLWRRG